MENKFDPDKYRAHLMPQRAAKAMLFEAFQHLADYPIKTAAGFRNALLGKGMLGLNPALNITNMHDARFLELLITQSVVEGRMIDFGFIPNEMLKIESTRSRDMFEMGELMQPYNDWLAVTAWEGGFNGYHFSQHPDHPDKTLILELYGVSMPGKPDVIVVYDIITIEVMGLDKTMIYPYESTIPEMNEPPELVKRGANSLDPLVTMLRLLADASVPVTMQEEPVRLNKSRAKQGRPPIPSHIIVDTRNYVTSFHAGAQPTARNGRNTPVATHASPIAHWRRAHLRHLSDGRIIPVKSSKVNWRDTDEFRRLFYKMKRPI